MATKKQRHAVALEKREQALAELKRSNLEAQREDRERRERRHQQIENAKNKGTNKTIEELEH